MAKPKGKVTVDDKVWQDIRTRVAGLDKRKVRVGVLGSKGGNAVHEGGITMIELAAIHEFGSPAAQIPERSFLRRTFKASSVWLPAFQAKLVRNVIVGKVGVEQALGLLGTKCAAMVKHTIVGGEHIPPPLKPATIARKGSDRPLVDTGRLVNAIDYEIVDSGAP